MQFMFMIEKSRPTDPRPAVTSLSFVSNEYFGDCDDEQVDGCDGLYDDFGGDAFYISSSPTYLGFGMGDDGCEMLTEETDEEVMDRYLTDIEDDDQELSLCEEFCDYFETTTAVAEAVKHALKIQQFFRLRKEAEERKAEEVACTETLDELEVVEIWQMRQVCHSSGGSEGSTVRQSKNSRRPWIGDRGGDTQFDYDKASVLSEVVVNERRYRVSRAA